MWGEVGESVIEGYRKLFHITDCQMEVMYGAYREDNINGKLNKPMIIFETFISNQIAVYTRSEMGDTFLTLSRYLIKRFAFENWANFHLNLNYFYYCWDK